MTEEAPGAAAKAAAEAASALKEALTKLGGAWPGADAAEPVPDEAASAARRARKTHDGLIRWMLGIFAAVGLLIFGSVPFVDLENVDFWPWAGWGLVIAGIGLAVVIWAATTGLETGDASLGELKRTLERNAEKPGWRFVWLSNRARANHELSQTLVSPEREAHLGPGIYDVGQLIKRIGVLERQVLQSEVGWGGGAAREQLESPPANDAADWRSSSIARQHVDEQVRTNLALTETALTELRAQLDKADDDDAKPPILEAIEQAEERYRDLAAMMPTKADLASTGAAKALAKARDRYLEHRALLLQEAAVSELRGTFRLVRGWLILGAALTLAGGVMYSYAIANPKDDEGVNTRVIATINQGTDAWTSLEPCRASADSDITGLEALLVSSDDADGQQNGPFTIVAIDSACAGTTVDVAEGGGSYALAPPASDASDDTGTAPDGTESGQAVLVTVTIKANTPAWKATAACRAPGDTTDVTDLTALLRSADDADAEGDGAFTIEAADARCPGLVVTVDDGDGSYERVGP